MAVCPTILIDSNKTGLWVAEEQCPGQLPVTPIWYAQEPNSYNSFGGSLETTQREFIDPGRQNQKGTPTTQDASVGWNQDLTKSNLTRLLQGFFFADVREGGATRPTNAVANGIGALAAPTSPNGMLAVTGPDASTRFAVNNLVMLRGFAVPGNNRLARVTAAVAALISFTDLAANAFVAEPTPPATAELCTVGLAFASGAVSVSYVSGVLTLVGTSVDFTLAQNNLFPGQWIFLGGDAVANKFANNVGFARVEKVTALTITLSHCTWTPVTEAGTGKSILIFVADTIKNETDPALIKKRTYTMERTLGLSSEGLVQAEYVQSAVANELAVSLPTNDKITVDTNYVAASTFERSGTGADLRMTGTRINSNKQRLINTTTDVYRTRMNLIDPANPNPTPLFGYITEANLSINNNVTSHNAVGKLGPIDTTVGTFNVSGSVTAYFSSTVIKNAIRTIKDVGFNIILAQENSGIVLDVPLVNLGGGEIDIQKDAPVMIPIDVRGVECPQGYSASYSEFKYLPNIAMPVAT